MADQADFVKECRLRLLSVPPRMFIEFVRLMNCDTPESEVPFWDLPDDVMFVSAHDDPSRRSILVLVASAEFSPVAEGEQIEVLPMFSNYVRRVGCLLNGSDSEVFRDENGDFTFSASHRSCLQS